LIGNLVGLIPILARAKARHYQLLIREMGLIGEDFLDRTLQSRWSQGGATVNQVVFCHNIHMPALGAGNLAVDSVTVIL
jgi:hypothetical protein